MSSIELIGLFTDCLTTARAGFLSKGSRNAIPLPTGRLRRWGAANRQSRCVALVHKRSRRRLLPAQGTVEYFHHTGLKTGAPCPVYAAAEAWSGIRAGPMPKAYRIEPRSAVTICGIDFEAFPVEHSLRAPAVGYRISAGRISVFLCARPCPDPRSARSARGAFTCISATKPRYRARSYEGAGEALIGHASIRMQLEWCCNEGVHRAIFSHCGSEIVAGGERAAIRKLRVLSVLSSNCDTDATIAYDGLSLTL
jgi:hypothetical protein